MLSRVFASLFSSCRCLAYVFSPLFFVIFTGDLLVLSCILSNVFPIAALLVVACLIYVLFTALNLLRRFYLSFSFYGCFPRCCRSYLVLFTGDFLVFACLILYFLPMIFSWLCVFSLLSSFYYCFACCCVSSPFLSLLCSSSFVLSMLISFYSCFACLLVIVILHRYFLFGRLFATVVSAFLSRQPSKHFMKSVSHCVGISAFIHEFPLRHLLGFLRVCYLLVSLLLSLTGEEISFFLKWFFLLGCDGPPKTTVGTDR